MARLATAVALLLATALPAPAAEADSPPEWCDSARRQVVEWSLEHANEPGRPHVTAIRYLDTTTDRVIESPPNGVVLRCLGRATLSNGLTTRVTYGFRAIDGSWYLFLRRARG